jgi:CBS domain containing-hemolysin-like protein
MEHPERILSSTLLMTSLCVIIISSLMTLYLLGLGLAHTELYSILFTSPLVVIFGELIPKTVFQKYSNRLAPWVAVPVSAVYWIFYPATRLLSGYTNRLSRLLGPIEILIGGKKKSTREELLTVISYGKRDSEIKSSEKKMIRRILDFKDSEAKHALIPLVKIDAISETTSTREALQKFRLHRYSRMPVYADRIDNITGIIELSHLADHKNLDQPITRDVTPAFYVAETQSLYDLLTEMRRRKVEMAVVVDEYGGAIGILTFEDIIEEIVGEIQDEFDSDKKPFKELSDTSWLIQSTMEVQAINEQLRLDLPEGDYETISGFLLQQFGRIPELGDELHFDTPSGSLKFTIKKASERQIESVLIERLASR